METVAIFYEIQGDTDGPPNVSFLSVPHGTEVLLIDLISYWLQEDPDASICYSFYTVSQNKLLLLDSPTSVLPIADQMTRLVLVPSSAPPVVPLTGSKGQGPVENDRSNSTYPIASRTLPKYDAADQHRDPLVESSSRAPPTLRDDFDWTGGSNSKFGTISSFQLFIP